jgi:2-polyprenyl-6-methoxyphenol hydroxylase-like FAD-dependent oxidoreductase
MKPSILIVGAGPSGAAAAIFMARPGWKVTLIDRQEVTGPVNHLPSKAGESLPPDAAMLLQQLGVWSGFQDAGHLPSFGNHSFWGSDKGMYTDFITHPAGRGWHLDRQRFERDLIDTAVQMGVELLEKTSLTAAEFENGVWEVQLSGMTRSFQFIVDASGRNAWFARRQGIDRIYEDRQLALIAFLQTDPDWSDSTGLIETAPEGWWYSAQIPGNQLAMTFLCRPTTDQRESWTQAEGWNNLLQAAPQTLDRLIKAKAELRMKPWFSAAESGILESICGPGWLAIGDAAMTYDPIASHGILMGMVTARDAAQAIDQYLNGDTEALERYNALLWTAYYRYVNEREQFYAAERRFAGERYWEGG